jgi:hypothetical protein
MQCHLTPHGIAACIVLLVPVVALAAGPVKVEIRSEKEGFRLFRGEKPYVIKGAVYWSDPDGKFPLSGLAERGGNSIRYGGGRHKRMLDAAQELGITVKIGLRMKMEWVHKFDYDDEEAVREQFDQVKATVLALKDHPALLLWGIGNELSVRYTNRNVWNAVNDVARMIHEVDPNHPAMTVIGDGSIRRGDIKEIAKRCPDLDLLGINYYKGVEAVPDLVRANGWDKPYVITEWGPSGDWQVKRTRWKASIEETSTEKAERYLERYHKTVLRDTELCLGSYVFIWSSRRERTHTWYGMFLDSGERTGAVNAMQFAWSGAWPGNRAPRVKPVRIDGRAAEDNVTLKPGTSHAATVEAEDPDGDPLRFEWQIMPEVPRAGYAGTGERHGKPMTQLVQEARDGRLTFTTPGKEGAYRVFVFVRDGKGNAATANIPFYVAP